jgi:hypothetical protein
MQKIILYTIVIVFSFLTKAVAQEDKKEKTIKKELKFEKQIENISISMEFLLAKEKNELKVKID